MIKKIIIKKRGEISTGLILSILITIIAFSLLFVLFSSRSRIPKKIYCNTIYKFNKIKKDSFCEEFLGLKFSNQKTDNINFFSNKKKIDVLEFNQTVNSLKQTRNVKIHKDSTVINSLLNASPIEKEIMSLPCARNSVTFQGHQMLFQFLICLSYQKIAFLIPLYSKLYFCISLFLIK